MPREGGGGIFGVKPPAPIAPTAPAPTTVSGPEEPGAGVFDVVLVGRTLFFFPFSSPDTTVVESLPDVGLLLFEGLLLGFVVEGVGVVCCCTWDTTVVVVEPGLFGINDVVETGTAPPVEV